MRIGSVLNSEVAGGKMAYGSFGELLGAAPAMSNNSNPYIASYAGYAYDAESGQYHTMFRQLDSKTARWLTKDPIGFMSGDTNLYRYASNGPTKYVDPTGLASCVYSISRHVLICTSDVTGQAIILGPDGVFSGNGDKFRNDPGSQNVPNKGPIPEGNYEISRHESKEGFWRLNLSFFDDLGQKRDAFELHIGVHSNGCITTQKGNSNAVNEFNRIDRLLSSEDGSNTLQVVR